ncbi:hypothetical protein, partial [Xenophilus sp. Marseille-Q4582]|uniref:hypothetical protein n=1 Tax=Xenophilus sp. Marseille-Q4582 TaxID=2866600 RepID=UPI001CE40D97
AAGAVGSVGLACLLVLGAVHAAKWCRMALGYGDVPAAGSHEEHELARQNAVTAAWDSGYMRRQFDPSWTAEEKAAWREGVAAQHADKRGA